MLNSESKLLAVISDIIEERAAQDKKWGIDQRHTLFGWIAILGEEFGEASQETLRVTYGGRSPQDLRAELVQVAAVATAFVEALDKGLTE